ncbi:plasmid pRiA4b ORF-3 family protein [Rhodococcus sp. NPDC056960]|uniref:plasmid pRiA4b ORF-3 family protein n=1 Tax=Rhodococcus sp. NPDC056960 TaxID=3345982 RepID=UPI00363A9C41
MTASGKRRHLSVVPDVPMIVRPSARRGRRDVASYHLRIELDEVTPPIWRQFVVPSNLFLHELHPIVQTVMGWQDSHLHSWVGGEPPASERYEMRESIDEGFADEDDELCEDAVRLDQVLAEPGELLSYLYDFGDGWDHTIVLERIDADGSAPTIACVAGARACPPEDCGGPGGYTDLLKVLATPSHPGHHDAGAWVGPGFAPESFGVDVVNRNLRLEAVIRDHGPVTDSKLADLLRRIPHQAAPHVFSLLEHAGLTDRRVGIEAAQDMATRHLRWFLQRIGPDGITLTQAGYLPPVVVAEMRQTLPGFDEWPATSNRETDQRPVHLLREYAKTLGLVRKYKGKLVRTNLGSSMAGDVVKMWRHLLERLPLGTDQVEREAGYLVLFTLAAGTSSDERRDAIAEGLAALGWRTSDGTVVGREELFWIARPTITFLELIGAMVEGYRQRDQPMDPQWGRLFAQMVLSM